MIPSLASAVPASYAAASDFKKVFSQDEVDKLRLGFEAREQPKLNVPGKSCETELFFGFFFDGTRNNYADSDTPRKFDGTLKLNHTNVARLYDCFPGLSVPGVLPKATDWEFQPDRYSHFFRVYVPGVGTPFEQIKDPGGALGAGFAAGGKDRIVWALIQAINCIHRYFLKVPLINNDEAFDVCLKTRLDRVGLIMSRAGRKTDEFGVLFTELLERLYRPLKPNLIDTVLGRPQKINPGIVTKINVSIFGFSRGSIQARAFANWFVELCKLDASLRFEPEGTLTLAGFPVVLNFMGLFDSVASVGLANSMGTILGQAEGHDGWADSDCSLKVASEIKRCLHLVAGHEVRRSFPLDSVSVGSTLPDNCREIVFPGVHSDLGGAYTPKEQGKGIDSTGADMISRVPLIYMYREARLAGVPLKLELAKPVTKDRFKLEPSTITAFNAYLGQCGTRSGSLTALMREQRKLFIQWKMLRRASGPQRLEATESFKRASSFDQSDLLSANLEFEHEIKTFEAWCSDLDSALGPREPHAFKPSRQPPGFNNSETSEWEEVATWWNEKISLHPDVTNFFDNYVHDSRAWFKLIPVGVWGAAADVSPDNEDEMRGLLQDWAFTQNRLARRKAWADKRGMITRETNDLTPEQRAAAKYFVRTGKIPLMINAGRETFTWAAAGYLRFRKVYAGADTLLLSQVDPSDEVPATHNA